MLSSTRLALVYRIWTARCSAQPSYILGLTTKAAGSDGTETPERKSKQWFALPPFPEQTRDGSLARKLLGLDGQRSKLTAIKWVSYCCPDLRLSAVLKFFSRKQVRVEYANSLDVCPITRREENKPQQKLISARDIMKTGSIIYLPVTAYSSKVNKRYDPIPRGTLYPNADEIKYIRRLVLYKDPAILLLNKPPQLPVQGSLDVHNSMDALAAAALSYDYQEGPKLVHRLDRESSGILVMGRTQESIELLHTLFQENTDAACTPKDFTHCQRTVERRYWALVIGCPKQKHGVISAPLTKVQVVFDGVKTERIIIANNAKMDCAQEAITEYRVLGPSVHGCTWMELCPLTGRKHQLRVHCAEALGTPIVGDYKYGWYVHKRWKQMPQIDMDPETGEQYRLKRQRVLNVEKGTVLAKVPLLHLHCRELIIPNVAKVLRQLNKADKQYSNSDTLRFSAPLPSHMAISWNVMCSCMV